MESRKDLEYMLSVALDLIYARNGTPDATIELGEAPFRVIAEHHKPFGWIFVLLQDRPGLLCDEELRATYGLTDREIEVARLLAERYTNKEIAERLCLSPYTAGRHTEHVLRKLGLGSRWAVRNKLCAP